MIDQLETQRPGLKNSRQPIAMLPDDALSCIFTLSTPTKGRRRGDSDMFCRTVLPSICRHWRRVAFDTKSLWSLVTISDSPPFKFSALCLERSGTTMPLDIEIHLSNRLWGYLDDPVPELYEFGMLDALEFIVECGGTTTRWRTFWLCTPEDTSSTVPLMTALDFIGKHPMPSLESLEIQYESQYEMVFGTPPAETTPEKSLFLSPPTRLKTTRLEGAPNTYLFSSLGQLVGLTRLEIKFPRTLPRIEQLYALLAASPALAVLSIDTRESYTSTPSSSDHREVVDYLPKIHMPNLRALGLLLSGCSCIEWLEYSLLLILDAPNVESLRLWLQKHYGQLTPITSPIVDYIVQGAGSRSRPLFPHLSALELHNARDNDFDERMLAVYPGITTLVLPTRKPHGVLSAQPWLVPSLHSLFICVMLKQEEANESSYGLFGRLFHSKPAPVELVDYDTKIWWMQKKIQNWEKLRNGVEGGVRDICTGLDTIPERVGSAFWALWSYEKADTEHLRRVIESSPDGIVQDISIASETYKRIQAALQYYATNITKSGP
ncbi:unnamed protein product [Rhizoctonia solani]|uniref:F-box domain-containing protein n=1 Tax=Rhizoctonia solani TaxID=456999 RepID=A0A8H3DWI7_9AGAM|nr:unnamed protein product [Rhizoctonia solani]